MKTIAELRAGVARRLWALASGYDWPAAPPVPPRDRAAGPRKELGHHPMWDGAEHPKGWVWPEWLNASCAWVGALRELYGRPMSFPYALSPEAGLLVHALVRNARPRTVIETGTFIGVSTIWMAAGLEAGAVLHTFDQFLPIRRDKWHDDEVLTGREESVRDVLARAGLEDRVRLHPGDSPFEVRRMHDEMRAGGGVQLAFIDADHSVDGAWLDFLAVEPVLSTGGYVILHDVFPEFSGHDGPRHVVDHLRERAAGVYETCDLCLAPVNHGLTVMRRVG